MWSSASAISRNEDRNLIRLALPLVVMAGFAGLAIAFARTQAIWIDETTQMSGLGLPWGAQFDWLKGGENPIPGVPPDRMPPLSYWLGKLWSAVFGLSEMSMRSFGIFAMICGAPAIFMAARDIGGRKAGPFLPALVLAMIYLAPGMIVQAGEIRAYPLYFAFAAWALFAYLRALIHPKAGKWLIMLAVFCLAAGYTHFFGTVMAGLMWLSLLIIRLARGEAALPVLLGGVVTALLFAGLIPFVMAAISLSSGADPQAPGLAEVIRDSARMATRLWLHGVHLSSPAIAGAALLGMAALVVVALLNLGQAGPVGIGLLLPVVLAMLVLPLLRLGIGGFDVLAPHYNLWLVPVFTLFAATGLVAVRLQNVALGATLLLIAAHLVADARLIRYSETYAHGPGEWIAAAISDPAQTIVIHDGTGTWGHAYFPLYFLTAGKLTQVLRDGNGAEQLLFPGGTAEFDGSAQDFATRIYVRTGTLRSADLAKRLSEPGDCGIPAMPVAPDVVGETRSYCAFEGATMVIAK